MTPEEMSWSPDELPGHIALMRERWRPGGPYFIAASMHGSGNKGEGVNYARWERDVLGVAQLWWLDVEFCDLVDVARPELPRSTRLFRDVFPVSEGFAAFARPMTGIDAQHGTTMYVHGLAWGVSNVMTAAGTLVPAVTMSWYRLMDTGLIPLGRSDWPLTDELDRVAVTPVEDFVAGIPDHFTESAIDDRRLFATVILAATQPGLAAPRVHHVARPAWRRAQRAGAPEDQRAVRIVTVRGASATSESDSEGRHLTRRHVVRAHWKQVAYGPSRTLRRPHLVTNYVRGPEGTPLDVRPTVFRPSG